MDSFLEKYQVKLNGINEVSKRLLEREPSKDEILAAIANLNNNASPGFDGVTSRLVKCLADLIPDILTKAIAKEMNGEHGKTEMTRLRKIILIEKRDTDKRTVKKLRPISLLATFYKVISTLLSTRLKGAIQENPILPRNQDAYVPGRSPSLSVALINDVLAKSKVENQDIFLVNTDLSAAFDTVSRNLIYKILLKMGMPQKYIKWIKTLIEGNLISLQVNGKEARRINHLRGLGQGDPLSALLFIISIIPIIEAIRTSKQIKGFNMRLTREQDEDQNEDLDTQVKGTYYSDDGINIALNTQEIRIILQVYTDFSECSDLEVNLSKTKIIHNHNIQPETVDELIQMGVSRTNINENYVFLGYDMCANRQSPEFLSADRLLSKITNKVALSTSKWDLKKQSIYGKETISSTLISSIFNYYLMAILPKPNKQVCELQKVVDKAFMSNTHCTKGKQRYLPTKLGGLGLPHIPSRILAYTAYWIKQLINYSKMERHLRPLALNNPIQMMRKWSITVKDLLIASPNDLRTLAHFIQTKSGSNLWTTVLLNIIEILRAFSEEAIVTQNSMTLWALQDPKKKGSILTMMKKKSLSKGSDDICKYIEKRDVPSIFSRRWRMLAREYPLLGDLLQKEKSTPITEQKIVDIISEADQSQEDLAEWAQRIRELINEKVRQHNVTNFPQLRKPELHYQLFLGDFDSTKRSSPGARIYIKKVYDLAYREISADAKW